MTTSPERTALSPLKRALLAIETLQARVAALEEERRTPIAIVGLGCRMPGGESPEAFWRAIRAGQCAVREVPPDRWSLDQYYDPDPDAPSKMCTRRGAFLEGVDLFEPAFFNISPREAVLLDPQQRLVLEVAWEALEHAGIPPTSLSRTATGVFVGIAAGDYADFLATDDPSRLEAYHASGVAHSMASGRLSYVLGLQGPSVSLDTACSSSLVAVHLAAQSLRTRECRLALAGGVSLMLTPRNGILFSRSKMLAPDGLSKAFDARADGFGRGEGCGMVVLKRLDDAVADGDRVLAVVRGSAVNQDGPSSGLTAPNGPSQEAVIREALEKAGVEPAQIGYVETHGTGTSLGDPIELQALAAVLGPGRAPSDPLPVASLKTNIGHLESAAGVAGLIKLVLMLQHREIPPHLHFETPNPHIPWDRLPISIPTGLEPWNVADGQRRIGGVSSFGFSGTNAHIVVEEAPVAERPVETTSRGLDVLPLSARSASALAGQAAQLLSWVEAHPEVPVEDVCHTAGAGRAHAAYRLGRVVHGRDELRDVLRGMQEAAPAARHAVKPRIAMVFTGQGAQRPGMGRALFESSPRFRETLTTADRVALDMTGESLLEVMFETDASGDRLNETAWAQPALFAIDYALADLWQSWGIEPAAVMGHSLGEYVAATLAGVFDFEAAMRLVLARGRLMQALPASGGMLAVAIDESRALELVESEPAELSLAAVNGPTSMVLSGRRERLASIAARLEAEGVRVKPLAVSHAFHSPLIEPMLDAFEAQVAAATPRAPRIPLISNVTGQVAGRELQTAAYWRRHARQPVQYQRGVETLVARGCTLAIEAGPHPTLAGLAAAFVDAQTLTWLASLRSGRPDWEVLAQSVASAYELGAEIDWRGFDAGYVRRRVALPTYPFERERYWADVAPPRSAARAPAAHPLLGQPLRSPALTGRVHEAWLSPDDPAWLRDHRVLDRVIVPAAGLVEMALSAVSAATGASALRLRDLVIERPLGVPDEGVLTQTIVEAEAPDRFRARVVSAVSRNTGAASSHAAEWITHASCSAVLDVERELVEHAGTRHVDRSAPVTDVYDRLHAVGLQLGPAFHVLRELEVSENRASGWLQLGEREAMAAWYLHPLLLDGAIQLVAAATGPEADAGVAWLPFSIGSMSARRATGPTPARVWAAVEVERPATHGGMLVATLRLFDEAGSAIATIRDMRFRRVRPRQLASQAAGVDDWFYEVRAVSRESAAGSFPVQPARLAEIAAPGIAQVTAAPGIAAYDELMPALDEAAVTFIADAFESLGFSFVPGRREPREGLRSRLRVLDRHEALFARWRDILVEAGLLSVDGGDLVSIGRPARPAVARLDAFESRAGVIDAGSIILRRAGPRLADVLTGAVDPLALLFPNGSMEDAQRMYRDSVAGHTFNGVARAMVEGLVRGWPQGRPLRVLEVGGGTAATTSWIWPALAEGGHDVRYLFTDLSPLFAARAADAFGASDRFAARALDLEQDLQAQGIGAGDFDLIVAANVVHATADLQATLRRLHQALAPGGLLCQLEVTTAQPWVDVTFGMTEGWWLFTDRECRPDYPLLPAARWHDVLRASGFTDIVQPMGKDDRLLLRSQHWFVARASDGMPAAEPNQASTPDRVTIVDLSGDDLAESVRMALSARGGPPVQHVQHVQLVPTVALAGTAVAETLRAALDPAPDHVVAVIATERDVLADPARLRSALHQTMGGLLALVQAMAAAGMSRACRLWLVTRGAQPAGDAAVEDPLGAAAWGFARTVRVEHPEWQCTTIDLQGQRDESVARLRSELADSGGELERLVRGEERLVTRLARAAVPTAEEASDDCALDISVKGVIDSLAWRGGARREPGPGEVEIEVAYTGLNFKDVMNVLGTYPGNPGALGGECAGCVTRVGPGVTELSEGDEVVALASGCFHRFVIADARFVAPRPVGLTLAEAATLPIASVTAAFALEDLGQIRVGDRVLIHAAAGGVGLAAVQIARAAGAEIFATAGTDEKRELVRSWGAHHVFSSRTIEFADGIRHLTNGRGVDVVLNSVAGDLMARSFEVTAPRGRFLELGKNAIWTSEQVAALGRAIDYHVIDWGETLRQDPSRMAAVMSRVVARAARGELRPLPARVFAGAKGAADGFRWMMQARHVGKVLIAPPVAPPDTSGVRAPIVPHATYLITGGFGGLGLELASWLVDEGARHLVLLGRNAPREPARARLDALAGRGARVLALEVDVADAGQLEGALVRVRREMPPLRGVYHAAGHLAPGVLARQTWDTMWDALAPKVMGASNLDRMTRVDPLDTFVLFSSIAGTLGSPGQGNHSAACAALDALASARAGEGLASISVAWGAWADTGAAAQHRVGERAGTEGLVAMPPEQALVALSRALGLRQAQVVVSDVDWAAIATKAVGRAPLVREMASEARVAERGPASDAAAPRTAPAPKPSLRAELSATPPALRDREMHAIVTKEASRVLGIRAGREIDPRQPLNELGLDSLMAVELRNALAATLELSLPATLLFDYPTLGALAGFLSAQVWTEEAAAPEAAEPVSMLDRISDLSDEEVDRLLAERLGGGPR